MRAQKLPRACFREFPQHRAVVADVVPEELHTCRIEYPQSKYCIALIQNSLGDVGGPLGDHQTSEPILAPAGRVSSEGLAQSFGLPH